MRLFFHNYFNENPNFIYKILFQTPVLSVFTEGGLFLWLILNVAINPRSIFKLKNPFLEKLGEISYGIYMFHPIAIVFSIRILQKYSLYNDYLLFPIVLLVAITTAGLSYEFYEKRFIQKKIRYSVFLSGENAKT